MLLKCVKSNTAEFKVGNIYPVIGSPYGSYHKVFPDLGWERVVTLKGQFLAFEVYEKKQKQITKEQAIEDGFVKLKSLKKCIKEGIVNKGYTQFINCPSVPNSTFKFYITDKMLSFFGQIATVLGSNENELWLSRDNNSEWSFPIETIEK